jgi:hypothetical protein
LFKGVAPTNGTAPPPGSGDTQQEEKEKDEEGNETKQKGATKKKKKEIDLPITPRVPCATKQELDRLIEQEV